MDNNKDLISSEDVKASLDGDEKALMEQLERAKQVALEQLQAKKSLSEQEKLKLQQEIANKEAALKNMKNKMNISVENDNTKRPINTKINSKSNNVSYDVKEQGINVNQVNGQVRQNISNQQQINNVPNANPQGVVQRDKKIKTHHFNAGNVKPVNNTPNNKPNPSKNKLSKNQIKANKKLAKKQAKEKAKQIKREKSNFRYIMTVILFILMFAFVFFLPEISMYVANWLSGNNDEGIITTGNLVCKKSSEDKNYDYDYLYTFYFSNSKLRRLRYKTTTSGSLSTDKDHLKKLNDNCENLKYQTKNLDGVKIKCRLEDNSSVVEQELSYMDIDVDKVTNGYIEAGGLYPNYKYKQNINKIEQEMRASGYNCERSK